MSDPTVLILDHAAEAYAELIHDAFPKLNITAAKDVESAKASFHRTEVLITFGLDLLPEHIANMPRLRWIQALSTGVDHFKKLLASRPDVVLTSMRGIHGPQISEMVLMHMLTLTRQVPRLIQQQHDRLWSPLPQPQLHGKTVLVIGMGVAGRAIASVSKSLGMCVHAVSRSKTPIPNVDTVFDRTQLLEAVGIADYIVLAIPLEPDTHHLIDAHVLAAMKPETYLINIARGAVVDEEALINALIDGQIAGAGLDVVMQEPLAPTSKLWALPNVFLTPHLAGRSDQYVAQAMTVIQQNFIQFISDDPDLVNLVAH